VSSRQRYSEEEVAAEEERIGARLPDALRQAYLDGMPSDVVLRCEDGSDGVFDTWRQGPSTTATDKKGRPWPTPGLAKETASVRDRLESVFPDDVLVVWAQDGSGDYAVVLRDGTLGWWAPREGDVVAVEVLWEPSQEVFDRVEDGLPI
jgi:hypothetical protein